MAQILIIWFILSFGFCLVWSVSRGLQKRTVNQRMEALRRIWILAHTCHGRIQLVSTAEAFRQQGDTNTALAIYQAINTANVPALSIWN